MKRILSFLASMLILAGNSTIPAYAKGPEDDWPVTVNMDANAVLQPWFNFKSWMMKPAKITYSFMGKDTNGKFRYGLWNVYIAGYDYNKVLMSEAESRITELGRSEEKPSWADWQYRLTGDFEVGMSDSTIVFGSSDGVELGNAPGVVYYALQIRDNGAVTGEKEPTYFWFYGKIDYRSCSYNSNKTPHMAEPCRPVVSADGKHYEYRSMSGEYGDPDKYMEWNEEWSLILNERLAELETKILAWDGGEEDELKFREQFSDTWATAADASEETQILETVTRLEELLTRRKTEIAEQKRQEEEQKRLEEEKRKEEEEKKRQEEEEKRKQEEEEKRRQEEEEKKKQEEASKPNKPNKPSVSNPNVTTPSNKGENLGSVVAVEDKLKHDMNGSGTSQTSKVATSTVLGGKKDSSKVEPDKIATSIDAEETAKLEESADREDERNNSATRMDVEGETEVPVLYSSNKAWRWLLWPLIVGLLMLMGWITWRIRKNYQDK